MILIENLLDRATKQNITDGKLWYKRLNRYLRDISMQYNIPQWKVGAIMSILSPRVSFKINLEDTITLIKHGNKAKLKSPIFIKKALLALNAKSYDEVRALFNEKTGPKTLAFFDNLVNPKSDKVTIDVHMIRALNIQGSLTSKKYKHAENIIREYASKVSLQPMQLQAILWTVQRGKAW